MRLAHHIPASMLTQLIDPGEDTYHVISVSQVLTNMSYRAFYHNAVLDGHYVMLKYDTGNSLHDMKSAIEMIWPMMIVLPYDVLRSDNFQIASHAATALLNYKIPYMAVPGGHNIHDYRRCAADMTRLPNVSCLGITTDIEEKLGTKRVDFIRSVAEWNTLFHLLDTGVDLRELNNPYLKWRCMGIDTAMFVKYGLNQMYPRLMSVEPHIATGESFFDLPALNLKEAEDRDKLDAIQSNMYYWRRIAGN